MEHWSVNHTLKLENSELNVFKNVRWNPHLYTDSCESSGHVLLQYYKITINWYYFNDF